MAANLAGRPNATVRDIRTVAVSIQPDAAVYKHCYQDLFGGYFPFVPEWQEELGYNWMTEEQEEVTLIYGWTACAFLALFALLLIFNILRLFVGYFYGHYDVSRNRCWT